MRNSSQHLRNGTSSRCAVCAGKFAGAIRPPASATVCVGFAPDPTRPASPTADAVARKPRRETLGFSSMMAPLFGPRSGSRADNPGAQPGCGL